MMKRALFCVHSTSPSGSNGKRSEVYQLWPRLAQSKKNKRREKLVKRHAVKRARLKAIVMDQGLPLEERFRATIRLAELPRNSAKVRIRNRCEVSGRPRGYYRKLKMSRIALRQLGSLGQIPGVVKSSW